MFILGLIKGFMIGWIARIIALSLFYALAKPFGDRVPAMLSDLLESYSGRAGLAAT